jgi:hypothetical protein
MNARTNYEQQQIIEVLAEPRPDAMMVHPFKVRFSTSRVKPETLPEFAYLPHSITFDAITYEAVINAHTLRDAIDEVKKMWPDASPDFAEQGNNSLQETRHLVVGQLGSFKRNEPAPGFWRWKK